MKKIILIIFFLNIFYVNSSLGIYNELSYILVLKKDRVLCLMNNHTCFKKYPISIGENNGPKLRIGDKKTPEGRYKVIFKNSRSKYHLALGISYPNERDRNRAKSLGIRNLGSSIVIHGVSPKDSYLYKNNKNYDSTRGCISLKNSDMEELYSLVPNKEIPIYINP